MIHPMSHGSDHELPPDPATSLHVQRAVRGDRDSLDWVVTRFSPLLRVQAAYRLGPALGGRIDPDDIVAEAWLVTLQRLGDLIQREGRHTPRLLRFLGTTIINLVNRRLDQVVRRKTAELERGADSDSDVAGPKETLTAEITGVVTRAVRREVRSKIEDCLVRLSDADRQVIVLRGIEGLTNQEAAHELGEDTSAVSHRYRRALQELRGMLPNSVFDELAED